MEKVQVRRRERRSTEIRPSASEWPVSALIELRQQPPPAHVAVHGRAVEMVGLPPFCNPAPQDRDNDS